MNTPPSVLIEIKTGLGGFSAGGASATGSFTTTDTVATDPFKGSTAVFQPAFTHTPVTTAVSAKVLDQVVKALTTVPADFKVHAKIKRFIDARAEAHVHDRQLLHRRTSPDNRAWHLLLG